MNSKVKKTIFYCCKYERHLLMPYDYMIELGVENTLDLLLDHGFTTKMELVRLDDEEKNIVEFVQDLHLNEDNENGGIKFKSYTDLTITGSDLYH